MGWRIGLQTKFLLLNMLLDVACAHSPPAGKKNLFFSGTLHRLIRTRKIMLPNWIDCLQRFNGLYSACYRLRILG